MDEQYFLEAIAANPTDITQRLIFADWLEEQGDTRCEAVRHQCRFRLPFTRAELPRFEKIARSRDDADGTIVDIDIELPTAEPGIYWNEDIQQSPEAVEEIVEHLDSNRLARYFPRDDGGRLRLKSHVVLVRVREGDPHDYHQLAIVAAGPGARRDAPQHIIVTLMSLRDRLVTEDWRRQRWRWDSRVPIGDELKAAGYDLQTAELANLDRGSYTLSSLWQKYRTGDLNEQERIAVATLLLDAGRFEDALTACNVDFVPELSQRLDGIPIWATEKQEQIERIARGLRRQLWEMAHWRFAELVADSSEPIRLSTTGTMPVYALLTPLARQVNRTKWWLALCRAESGRPILDFVETTATEAAAPHLWKRPVEFDLARFGDD